MDSGDCDQAPDRSNRSDENLDRLRDRVVFYFNLDIGFVAALAAGASFLKIEGSDLVRELAAYREAIFYLGVLLGSCLVLEYSLTIARGKPFEDEAAGLRTFRGFVATIGPHAYLAIILCHTLMLAYILGMVDAYLGIISASAVGGGQT